MNNRYPHVIKKCSMTTPFCCIGSIYRYIDIFISIRTDSSEKTVLCVHGQGAASREADQLGVAGLHLI